MNAYLFNSGNMYSQIEEWGKALRKAILDYPPDALLNASGDSLIEHFTEEFSIAPLQFARMR